jgi:hypothetical protein
VGKHRARRAAVEREAATTRIARDIFFFKKAVSLLKLLKKIFVKRRAAHSFAQ